MGGKDRALPPPHPTELAEPLGASTLSDNAALTSIAISLKRLADLAETMAMGFWNYDPTRGPYGQPKAHVHSEPRQ